MPTKTTAYPLDLSTMEPAERTLIADALDAYHLAAVPSPASLIDGLRPGVLAGGARDGAPKAGGYLETNPGTERRR